MEEVRNTLIVTRKEYTNQLVDLLYRPLYVGIQSIWEDSKRSSKPREAYGKFQERLDKIPRWNQTVITKEYNRIVDKSKCDYLDELVKKVFILHTQLLAAHSADPNRKIRLSVPKTDDFIHKCYDTCGKSFFENPMLMEDRAERLDTKRRIRNLEDSLKIIKEGIQATIRSMLPFRNLLKEDINNEEGEDISPSPELYQRVDAFNNMYKTGGGSSHEASPPVAARVSSPEPQHDIPVSEQPPPSFIQPTPEFKLPDNRPLTSFPTLGSVLEPPITSNDNGYKSNNERLSEKSSEKESSDSDARYRREKQERFRKSINEDNKESVKEIFLGRPLLTRTSRLDRFNKFGKKPKEVVDTDTDSDAAADSKKFKGYDNDSVLTNNANPLIRDQGEKERQKIDLDVNTTEEELPIASFLKPAILQNDAEKLTDDTIRKVPAIKNFDAANFFSDNE